jgi:hypothetical protein
MGWKASQGDSMNEKTQGRKLIKLLKRQPMTSMELLMTGISTCWWKRCKESLQEGESLVIVGKKGRSNVYLVVTEKKYVPKTVWVKR